MEGAAVKLKRCPYCNSHELMMDCSMTHFWIKCLNCGATGPLSLTKNIAGSFFNGDHRHQNPAALVRDRKSNRGDLKEVDV